jgi:hypothetical protein
MNAPVFTGNPIPFALQIASQVDEKEIFMWVSCFTT